MDSKEKFSNKVENYLKYRPSYAGQFIAYLFQEIGLSKDSAVADIGAGTGILTRQLAGGVKSIYAVEPNLNMRKACESDCRQFDNVAAVEGSAEETTLAGKSVDFITAGQAFHWFDRHKSRVEFQRILRPGGKAILVWNWRPPGSPLTHEFGEFCRRMCPDYQGSAGGSDMAPAAYSDFFKNGRCEHRVFDNQRVLSLEGYIGSSLSSSWAPVESDGHYGQFITGLSLLFDKYSDKGKLTVPNQTHSYVGLV